MCWQMRFRQDLERLISNLCLPIRPILERIRLHCLSQRKDLERQHSKLRMPSFINLERNHLCRLHWRQNLQQRHHPMRVPIRPNLQRIRLRRQLPNWSILQRNFEEMRLPIRPKLERKHLCLLLRWSNMEPNPQHLCLRHWLSLERILMLWSMQRRKNPRYHQRSMCLPSR